MLIRFRIPREEVNSKQDSSSSSPFTIPWAAPDSLPDPSYRNCVIDGKPSDRGETKVRYRGEEYESRNREPDRTPEAT